MPRKKKTVEYVHKIQLSQTLIEDEFLKEYKHRENLFSIIDTIQQRENYHKRNIFTEIPLIIFKEILTSDALSRDLKFLINHGYIARNDSYEAGIRAKSYKILKKCWGKPEEYEFKSRLLNQRYQQQINKNNEWHSETLRLQHSHFLKMEIDVMKANEEIRTTAIQRLKQLAADRKYYPTQQELEDLLDAKKSSKLMELKLSLNEYKFDNIINDYLKDLKRVEAIDKKRFYFKQNATNNRLDTNFTNLPKYLRKYIKSDEPLMSIDIVNAQPYFLYVHLKSGNIIPFEILKKYSDLVTHGNFYDFMLEHYNQIHPKQKTREEIKKMILIIFNSECGKNQNEKAFFGSFFPEIMGYINETNRVENNTLHIILTKLEAHMILNVILKELEKHKIFPYTIHDCIVCKRSQVKRVRSAIIVQFAMMYGHPPALKTSFVDQTWNDDDNSFEENEGTFRTDIYQNNSLSYLSGMFPNQTN